MALPTPKRIKGLLELMDEALEMDAAYEGVKRLGLKEGNTAADRAKALGFDTKNTWYRGDKPNLESFNATNNDSRIKGNIFLSNENAIARGYAHGEQSKNYLKGADELNESDGLYSLLVKQNPNELKVNAKGSSWADIKVPKELKGVDTYDGTIQIDDLAEIAKGKNYSSLQVDNVLDQFGKGKQKVIFDPSQIRSTTAYFNPKKAGIGAGSIMSSNLLAAPSGQPEFREAPMGFLDKAKKYAADSYEYAANEGGPVGKFLYSGGAKALKDIEQGTTPMVKTGRLPAMPTGAALARLLELLQL